MPAIIADAGEKASEHRRGIRVEADVKGLRDRAVIGVMAYTFARVSAVLKLKRGDYTLQGKRGRLRLQEKGGKEKLVWLHHEAEQYLDAYLEADDKHCCVPPSV